MVQLTANQQAVLDGGGGEAAATAMRVVVETARMLGADQLVPIASVHVDGCLYHGDSGTHFVELLVRQGGRVAVPTTLNVGALDLVHPERVRHAPEAAAMARRMTAAYAALGCRETWTCAPYQAGHRPAFGTHVAWGESNAIAFCNSVLGARTDRYGDFLDICAALSGFAPRVGFHLDERRRGDAVVELGHLPAALTADEAFYPVLGAWLGVELGDAVPVLVGLAPPIDEDRLKALGAAAAATGAIGLFHLVGVTPEAPTEATATGGRRLPRLRPSAADLAAARDRLSTGAPQGLIEGAIDAVAIGSPHLSFDEVQRLVGLLGGRRCAVPFYACTGRHTVAAIEAAGLAGALAAADVTLVVDTCVVVAPVLPPGGGLLMTNSGKFAHYTPANTGYDVVFGTLADCVESAVAGRVRRDERLWR